MNANASPNNGVRVLLLRDDDSGWTISHPASGKDNLVRMHRHPAAAAASLHKIKIIVHKCYGYIMISGYT